MKPSEYIDRVLLNESSGTLLRIPDDTIDYDLTEYYRGVSKSQLAEWLNGNNIPSTDVMPLDPEIVEYGMGDDYKNADDEQIDRWVKTVCPWYDGSLRSVKGGLNVTSDFDNAKGYGDYVLGIDPAKNSEIADFSEYHHFFKNAKTAKLSFVYDVKKRKFFKVQKRKI